MPQTTATPNAPDDPPTSGAGRLPSSFRDPSGFVFRRDGRIFRQVNRVYQPHFDHLIDSGLYAKLAGLGILVRHDEVDVPPQDPATAYKVIAPDPLPFISYPYEWSFSQLKDAARLTLDIQKLAIDHGMVLKDASAFNIQFHRGRPIFIDTLSFELLRERPWTCYRQFTEHFLGPLALRARTDVRLGTFVRQGLDGIPIEQAGLLLPRSTYFSPGLLIHIHLHAKTVGRYSTQAASTATTAKRSIPKFSKTSLIALAESLLSTVEGLKWNPKGTEWADYAEEHGYTADARAQKLEFVARFLDENRPKSLWDLASNTGDFGRLASQRGISTIAFDIDPACAERAYQRVKRDKDEHFLPLLMDLTNPSPALGWMGSERLSFFERGPADAALALALIHHLCVSGNVPLAQTAEFFRRIASKLVIEFVPKSDPQFQRLMTVRDDVFDDYSIEGFEAAFQTHFRIVRKEPIVESERTIYEMAAITTV